jgi:uncharacterized protein with PIN domain
MKLKSVKCPLCNSELQIIRGIVRCDKINQKERKRSFFVKCESCGRRYNYTYSLTVDESIN